MAHSYNYIEDKNERRSFGATDSIIFIYMRYFLEVIKGDTDEKVNDVKTVYEDYYLDQLESRYTSMVDLNLNYVYDDLSKRKWYLNRLAKVENKFKLHGECIDFNYLNTLEGLKKKYSRPIPVKKLLHFTNNIRWLLGVDKIKPLGDFVFMHDKL